MKLDKEMLEIIEDVKKVMVDRDKAEAKVAEQAEEIAEVKKEMKRFIDAYNKDQTVVGHCAIGTAQCDRFESYLESGKWI